MDQLAEREPDQQRLGGEDVDAEQGLVAHATGVGIGQQAGDQRCDGQQPAEVVVEVGDQALHRIGDAVDQHREQRGDGDRREEGDGRRRQGRPAEAEDPLEVGADQALEHVLEEQQVRHVEEQRDQEADVEGVAHHLAEGRPAEELLARPGAQGNQAQSLPLGRVARGGQVGLGAQEEDADQAPQQPEQEDGDRPLQGRAARELEQGHDCFSSASRCRLRPRAAATAPSAMPAPAAAATVLPDPQSPVDSGW